MTREEAIESLRGILTEAVEFENSVCYVTEEDREPLEMAIKALEQEPSVDVINRQAVLDILLKYKLSKSRRIAEELRALPSINLQESSVEIVKTEESNDNGTKYLNINVSDNEVKRNPDVVRLCSDVGVLEYMKKAESEDNEHENMDNNLLDSRN